jgi:FkbM family methyltransferase
MKNFLKYILQKLLGFHNYLFVFCLFKIKTLHKDKSEKDFLYFLKLIPSGGIVLDIGANIGIMTVYLARKIKDVTIFAFEPIPHNVKVLERVISHYKLKNVTICKHALGDEDGEIEMVMPVIDLVKMQGLSHVVHKSIPDNNTGERFTIPVKKIDSIQEIMNGTKPVTAIKMDVENFEYFVLDGAKELLKKYKPIIYCELWDNENRSKCFELMQSLGYGIKILVNGELAVFTTEVAKAYPTQNFFFIHKTFQP